MNKRDLQAYLALNAAATKKSRNKKKYTRKGKAKFAGWFLRLGFFWSQAIFEAKRFCRTPMLVYN